MWHIVVRCHRAEAHPKNDCVTRPCTCPCNDCDTHPHTCPYTCPCAWSCTCLRTHALRSTAYAHTHVLRSHTPGKKIRILGVRVLSSVQTWHPMRASNCSRVRPWRSHANVDTTPYIALCRQARVYTHFYAHVCTRVFTPVHTHIYIHVYTHACAPVCTYVYTQPRPRPVDTSLTQACGYITDSGLWIHP